MPYCYQNNALAKRATGGISYPFLSCTSKNNQGDSGQENPLSGTRQNQKHVTFEREGEPCIWPSCSPDWIMNLVPRLAIRQPLPCPHPAHQAGRSGRGTALIPRYPFIPSNNLVEPGSILKVGQKRQFSRWDSVFSL